MHHRAITILGLAQVGIVVLVWLLFTIDLKFHGYPDNPMLVFNGDAVWVRDHVYRLLLFPIVWLLVVACLTNSRHATGAGVIGFVLFLILVTRLCYIALPTHTRPLFQAVELNDYAEHRVSGTR